MIKVIFHRVDLDGQCSGALLKEYYPDAEMIGLDYYESFPWEDIAADDLVIMVDFSLEPFSDMLRLNELCNLRWIDHHKTALDKCILSGVTFAGLQRVGEAGCELTWEWLYGDYPIPTIVSLLGRYDVWDHQDPRVLPIQMRLRMEDLMPTTEEAIEKWTGLFLPERYTLGYLEELVEEGELLLKYQEKQDQDYCSKFSFEAKFLHPLRGDNAVLTALCLNRGGVNSNSFKSIYDPSKHDLMVGFVMLKDNTYRIRLYATEEDIDVGEIAKFYGGGGHAQASGFQCSRLPFSQNAEGLWR